MITILSLRENYWKWTSDLSLPCLHLSDVLLYDDCCLLLLNKLLSSAERSELSLNSASSFNHQSILLLCDIAYITNIREEQCVLSDLMLPLKTDWIEVAASLWIRKDDRWIRDRTKAWRAKTSLVIFFTKVLAWCPLVIAWILIAASFIFLYLIVAYWK